MPVPATKLFLSSLGAGGYAYTPGDPGDFAAEAGGLIVPMTLAGIEDLNGDLIPDLIIGAPGQSNGNNPLNQDSGEVVIRFGSATGGFSTKLGDDLAIEITLNGKDGGDLAGAAVASIRDLNGDGLAEILVGAPGVDDGGTDAGAAFVVWGAAGPDDITLATLDADQGFLIEGAAAGDRAGGAMAAIGDLNGDGREEILIGAAGQDAGAVDAGAAYVVFGKANGATVDLGALGARGYRIRGEAAGDGAGAALGTVGDLNGDGREEILVGAAGNDAGGADAGAAYVVFGKGTTGEVSLGALGAGGFRIRGASAGEQAGGALTGLGDVNGDGLSDILVGAEGGGKAYVVYGKAGTAEVLLSDVAAGIGGYAITAEAPGDLIGMTVATGGDLNRDGVADLVIGAPGNAEGGANAGAVYVVWGGGTGPVDLSLVAQGQGGAKIVGTAGSRAGAAVAVLDDMNGDGTPDLFVGASGLTGEAARVVFAPASWQPDPNVYGTNGADTMAAGYGGLVRIGATSDSVYANGGSDSVDAGDGADSVDGGAGADTLAGGAGDDSLDGGTGADSLAGGQGNDTYAVDSALDLVLELPGGGSDTVRAAVDYTLSAEVEALVLTGAARAGTGHGGANTLAGTAFEDTLSGLGGADSLAGEAGADSLDGGTGADTMAGGAGNDTYAVDALGDLAVEASGGGSDTVRAAIDWTLGAELEGLVLAGAAAHRGTGNALANVITGGAGIDTLEGLAGSDTLVGGDGADRLDGGTGSDSMAGGAGNDTYLVDAAGDLVAEAAGAGSDTVVASADYTISTGVELLRLTGTARSGTGNAEANTIRANDLGDTLSGAGGADTLLGGTGADWLEGGAEADSMRGGAGDDTYVVTDTGDVVVELAGGGFDTVIVSTDWTLVENIEAVVLVGGNNRLTGNAGNNALTGSTGDDTLDGAAGSDTLSGGTGNDTYLVDSLGDVMVEAPGEGIDTVIASIDLALAEGVEALVLAGTAHHGTGNAGDNTLTGGDGADSLEGLEGNDRLDGGAGPDTMAGGAGDDTYVIGDPGDVVIEAAGGGFDTVVVGSDWTLAENIEAVQLVGGGHALTGNAGNNQLSGGGANDTLDGGLGDDTQLGGDGDDVLVCEDGVDALSGGSGDDRFEIRGGGAHLDDFLGHDTLDASDALGDSSIDLSGETESEIENEICTIGQGGSSNAPLDVMFLQDLTGSFADDIAAVRLLVPDIVAALAAVQPDSEFGVSTFRDKAIGAFGSPGDWVYEQELGLSTDTAALTAAYAGMVASGGADGPEAQIEALMQLALHDAEAGYRLNSARFVVVFTDAPYHMAGDGISAGITTPNNGDGVLDGTPPGTGEDYPAIAQLKAALEAANIIPIFAVAGGFDADYQALVAELGRGAEVTLTSDSSNVVAAITAGLNGATTTVIEDAWGGSGNDTVRGNAAGNALEGRDGDDSLDGLSGDDTLTGGLGDDAYRVDGLGDLVVEAAEGGVDTLFASVDWTLGTGLEHLVLTGALAALGTGNDLANRLAAGEAAATLAGLGGADTLTGGALGDLLDGGAGADSMAGGLGDDTYVVDAAGDVVLEAAGEGVDTVLASVSLALGAALENLTLTGTAALNGLGNAAANAMTGNAAANAMNAGAGDDALDGGAGDDRLLGGAGADTVLGGAENDTVDGGAGADSLAGGAGDDRYIVDGPGDLVLELAGEGVDLVQASVSHVLAAEVEKLTLLGNGALSGAGNTLANTLTGNAGANQLAGLAGADTIIGGAGADTLLGGLGADGLVGGAGGDAFRYAAAAEGGDAILDFAAGLDRVEVSAGGFGAGLVAGMDLVAAGRLVVGTAADQAFGQFLYDGATGRLGWDADGTGGAGPVLLATVSGLTAADLFVVA